MTRWLFMTWLGLALAPSTMAQEAPDRSPSGCQKLASEFYTVELCPVTIPAIAKVQIDPPPPPRGELRPGEDCTTFRPGLPEIRRFWARTGQISSQSYMHGLDIATCGVKGTLVFHDGRKAGWYVNAARMGTLRIEGEPEEKALYLFCPDCNFAPFWDWNTDEEFLPVRQ